MKKSNITVIATDEEKELNLRKFNLNGDTCIIKMRKRDLEKKPLLYIWNLSKMCYVSSLKRTSATGIFSFDIKNKETERLELYQLILDNHKISVQDITNTISL